MLSVSVVLKLTCLRNRNMTTDNNKNIDPGEFDIENIRVNYCYFQAETRMQLHRDKKRFYSYQIIL